MISLFGLDGADTLLGGDGDDSIFITTVNGLSSGKTISGGSGTDTLFISGSTLTSIISVGLTVETMEKFDLSLGADAGVFVTMDAADLEAFATIIGDGTSDTIGATRKLHLK